MAQNTILSGNSFSDKHAPKIIYGTILMFVVLLGLDSSKPTSALVAALESLLAAITIIIAEDYSEVIGYTIKNKRPLNQREKKLIFSDTLTLSAFSFTPSAILLSSYLGFYELKSAFKFSFIYCIGILLFFSFRASELSGYSRKKSLITTVLVTFFGLAITFAKYKFGK